jgi:hypothetical protein
MALTGWAVDELKSDAEVIRQSIGSLIGSAGGLVAAGGLELKQKGTPNMSVQIKGGTPAEGGLWIPGYTTSTGPYYFQNSATYEQVIEASGAEPRVDTIVARMYDNAVDSSGKTEPVFQALKGVEASGTTLGNKKGIAAVPKNCSVLGYVLVEKGASSIVTADIEQAATVVVGGVAPPAESVTDSAVVKGRALVETGNSWKSLAYTKGETITPNASRETAVSIEVLGEDNELVAIQVSVNGQSVGEAVGGPIEGRHTQIVFPTIVPANQTLKVGGSYTIINIKALTR